MLILPGRKNTQEPRKICPNLLNVYNRYLFPRVEITCTLKTDSSIPQHISHLPPSVPGHHLSRGKLNLTSDHAGSRVFLCPHPFLERMPGSTSGVLQANAKISFDTFPTFRSSAQNGCWSQARLILFFLLASKPMQETFFNPEKSIRIWKIFYNWEALY